MSGIPNLGNTCYASTCLQALRHCRAFRAFVKAYSDSLPSQLITLLDRFYDMLDDVNSDPGRISVVAGALYRMLSRYKNLGSIAASDQGDVHEFLMELVDIIAKDSTVFKAPKTPIRHVHKGAFAVELFKLAQSMDKEFFARKLDYVEWLFMGQNISMKRCKKCGNSNVRPEEFSSLLLHARGGAEDFGDCLRRRLGEEAIDDVVCEACKCRVQMEITTRIFRPPPILIAVVTGPKTDMKGVPKTMDISALLWRPTCDGPPLYDLVAAACHLGNPSSGHYVALCRKDGAWTMYDDHRTREVADIDRALRDAHVLIFERNNFVMV